MAIIEVQIRTERFCELVRNLFNVETLKSPTEEGLDVLKGKWLERIECANCSLDTPSENSGEFRLAAQILFHFHESLQNVRNAGSLTRAATSQTEIGFKIRFWIAFDPALPAPPVLNYEALALGILKVKSGNFPLEIPSGMSIRAAAIEADEHIVAIRLGMAIDDDVRATPVDRVGAGEWIQRIPGSLVADTVRKALDDAIGAAVAPPPPPDPNKPWLPRPKPKNLERGDPTAAAWISWPEAAAVGKGEIVAVDACPLFDVDISIELTLWLTIEFPAPHMMKTVARLTWDADSTWCDVWSTVLLGVPVGIAIHVGAEGAASEAILGESISPGQGFVEVSRSDESITLERITWPPSEPSVDFERTHSEATGDGFQSGGLVRPRATPPELVGQMIPAKAKLDIDCNLRSTRMVFDPAQVILRNAAPRYIGPPPKVFLDRTVFEPPGAWSVRTDIVNMADPHSTARQTVLTFIDPPGGRLPPGTATSVFLFTDFGVRWVNLGTIPVVPKQPPAWADRLMGDYCDSITNPWAGGLTRLGWNDVDPLLDPDYDSLFEIDPVRLWTIGLSKLPLSAQIEILAIGPTGSERLLGTVQGRRSAALQLVTDANETLAMRPVKAFDAPAPTLLRSWVFPASAHDLAYEPATMAAADGEVVVSQLGAEPRAIGLRSVREGLELGRLSSSTEKRIGEPLRLALERAELRKRDAWATPVQLDRDTIAVLHRGQLLVGVVGATRRVR